MFENIFNTRTRMNVYWKYLIYFIIILINNTKTHINKLCLIQFLKPCNVQYRHKIAYYICINCIIVYEYKLILVLLFSSHNSTVKSKKNKGFTFKAKTDLVRP